MAAEPYVDRAGSRARTATRFGVTNTVLAIIGVGVSIYLTWAHYTSAKNLACSDKGTINCLKVTTSPQSVIFGIPVAMLGLAYFVPMLALCLPAAWRSADRRIHLARLALSVVGVGMILYLLIAELFIIKAICLWCSSVHLVTFILFIIIVTSSPVVLAAGYGHGGDEDWDETSLAGA